MDFYRPPTTRGTLEALGALYRAVRVWRFYPKGHPTRRSSLQLAHTAMLELLDGNTLQLACGSSCFSFPDGEVLKDTTGISGALSFELFVRRVQKITFSHDLFQEDLLELFKILCMSPEIIHDSGGIDGIINASDIIPAVDLFLSLPFPDEPSAEQQLPSLLTRLTTCDDDDIYLMLIHQAVACADALHVRHDFPPILSLVELLACHADEDRRSTTMRECAQFALEQILTAGDLLKIVLDGIGQDNAVSQQAQLALLKAGGTTAITAAIELIGRTSSIKIRKTLSTLLACLGSAAVPTLLDLMQDTRWFIIRNICAILGVIASHEALGALTACLHHADLRVRKEAIRSVAQLGGREAEAVIIAILRGTDTALYPQAIASLGGLKSKKALVELVKIISTRDMFLQSLSLRINALAAIASIGDPQVTPTLVARLKERHFLAASRGKQLKCAIAACLGKLGDTRAVPLLEKLAAGGGELGAVCSEAISLIEKTEGKTDEITR